MLADLTISRLGAQGDGVTETADGPVYVPFTLPGERITAEVADGRGQLVAIHEPSPERQTPLCRHFGECGGCSLQHFTGKACAAWKRQRVVEALGCEHIEADVVAPPFSAGPGSRRRAALSALKAGGKLALGFRRALSRDIVDLQECPVLVPRLAAALPDLRNLLAGLLPGAEARVVLTAADNGLDVSLECKEKLLPLKPALGAKAESMGILRIAAGKDLIFSVGQPHITLAGVAVDMPPGAFLQASAEAENAMVALAVEAVRKTRRAADLFSGLGTFTFALARKANVTAAEHDHALLAALEVAARRAPGLKPVKSLRRDLMREPLSPLELNAFDAVLLDPPRAGAFAQAKALAKSRVPKVVAVSCNPATFARDAHVLLDGGFVLQRVVPVDQFVFSAHVELVAVFARK